MTNDPCKLVSICNPKQSKVLTANGYVCVTCEGPVHILESMNRDNVLVIPSLSPNMFSISQSTKNLNCFATLWPDECMFQDIKTQRILSYDTRRGKLYYLEDQKHGEALNTRIAQENKTMTWLWHYRLGHLSFNYLQN